MRSLSLKTKFACVSIVLLGVVLHIVYGHLAFHPNSSWSVVMRRAFIGYLIAVPVTLGILRGDRAWRWAVFGIWVAYVGFIALVMYTMD